MVSLDNDIISIAPKAAPLGAVGARSDPGVGGRGITTREETEPIKRKCCIPTKFAVLLVVVLGLLGYVMYEVLYSVFEDGRLVTVGISTDDLEELCGSELLCDDEITDCIMHGSSCSCYCGEAIFWAFVGAGVWEQTNPRPDDESGNSTRRVLSSSRSSGSLIFAEELGRTMEQLHFIESPFGTADVRSSLRGKFRLDTKTGVDHQLNL